MLERGPYHRSDVLRRSLPQGPSAHPRNTEDPSISEQRVRRRVEMKQQRERVHQRQRGNK